MKIMVALALIGGAIGYVMFGGGPMQQMASASDMPRQLSQLTR